MTVKRVEVLAYAKINLMLDIIRRRTDGYHDLFMIMQSVGVADRVTVEREPGRKLRLTAIIYHIPLHDKNIPCKAAALFFIIRDADVTVNSRSLFSLSTCPGQTG